MQQIQKAEAVIYQLIPILKEQNNYYSLGVAYNTLAEIYTNINLPEQSIENYVKSYYYKKIAYPNNTFIPQLVNIGNTYLKLGELKNAKSYYDEAMDVMQSTGGKDINLLKGLCQYFIILKEYEKAIELKEQIEVLQEEQYNLDKEKVIQELKVKYDVVLKQKEISYRKKKQSEACMA